MSLVARWANAGKTDGRTAKMLGRPRDVLPRRALIRPC